MKTKRVKERWDEPLLCFVLKLHYDFCTQEGEIYFPEGQCGDLTGCVARFRAIDPHVQVIWTFSGGKPDVVYFFDPDTNQWAPSMR